MQGKFWLELGVGYGKDDTIYIGTVNNAPLSSSDASVQVQADSRRAVAVMEVGKGIGSTSMLLFVRCDGCSVLDRRRQDDVAGVGQRQAHGGRSM
jgi:hypothetical protein